MHRPIVFGGFRGCRSQPLFPSAKIDRQNDGGQETAEAVKEGLDHTVEVVAETTEDVKERVEDTADVFEDTAKEATDADTYTSSDEERKSREFNEAGGKEPMNPEDIASHEPTAVKRDKKQGTSGDPV